MRIREDKIAKTRVMISAAILVIVVVSFLAWAVLSAHDGSSADSFMLVAVALAILGIAAAVLIRAWRSQKEGFPIEDELAKSSRLHAAAFAFSGNMYFLVALMIYHVLKDDQGDLPEISGEHTIVLIVIADAIFFLGSWLYFSRKCVPS